MTTDYERALSSAGVATLNTLGALEETYRRLHPPQMKELRAALVPLRETLEAGLKPFRAATPAPEMEFFHKRFLEAAQSALKAVTLFTEEPPPHLMIQQVLSSMRTRCRALESLYTLHRFPPISRFFVEPAFHDRVERLDPDPPEGVSVGLHQTKDHEQRGGFCLYVPERYDGTEDWPLVVALHGGSGTGRDFLWTWLREARGRRFLLLAPTARGPTWSMMGPDVDEPALRAMVDYVTKNWRVKQSSVLLTGLSDGATYTLQVGLREGSPFTALAPVSGVLHPALAMGDGLTTAVVGRRIYLVHGALDWMFPIATAREARTRLQEAGADIEFREIGDLSHTYPREENDRILRWFDPSLAIPSTQERGM